MDQIFKRASGFLKESVSDKITIKNFGSNLKVPMNNRSGMERRIRNLKEQTDWRTRINLTINTDSITISTSVLFKILMNTMNLNEETVKELIEILTPLLWNYAGVGDLIVVYEMLIQGKKDQIFNYLPNILQIMVYAHYNANNLKYEHQTIRLGNEGPVRQSNIKTDPESKMNAVMDTKLFRGIL